MNKYQSLHSKALSQICCKEVSDKDFLFSSADFLSWKGRHFMRFTNYAWPWGALHDTVWVKPLCKKQCANKILLHDVLIDRWSQMLWQLSRACRLVPRVQKKNHPGTQRTLPTMMNNRQTLLMDWAREHRHKNWIQELFQPSFKHLLWNAWKSGLTTLENISS